MIEKDIVLEDICENKDKSFLVVLNTVKSSKNIYKYLKENTDREHIATDDMKKLTNFYNIKQLKENLTKQKEQMISYKDIQDFYKYEDFTKDNVDKKLIYPILKYNNSLIKQNHDLLLELSKVKNVKNIIQNYK